MVFLITCFDCYTGDQNITFYGIGNNEEEAIQSVDIPKRYEINDIIELCTVDEMIKEVGLSMEIKAFLEAEAGKPDCKLIGEDGNVFNLISIASRTLEKHGVSWKADEMRKRIYDCDSYDEALRIIGEYVNII